MNSDAMEWFVKNGTKYSDVSILILGRLRITFSAGHTAADVEALVKALPVWAKKKGPSPNFLPTPVSWFPSSLEKVATQKCLHEKHEKVQDKQVRLRPKL